MEISGVLSLVLAFLFIILSDVTIRIRHKETTSVRIDLTIFSLTLSESKFHKRYIKNSVRIIRNLPYIIKALHRTLKRTSVTVFKFSLNDRDLTPPSIFKTIPFIITTATILTYLNNTAKDIKLIDPPDENDHLIAGIDADVVFKTELINLIIFPILFLYYKLKSKIRRVIKNV